MKFKAAALSALVLLPVASIAALTVVKVTTRSEKYAMVTPASDSCHEAAVASGACSHATRSAMATASTTPAPAATITVAKLDDSAGGCAYSAEPAKAQTAAVQIAKLDGGCLGTTEPAVTVAMLEPTAPAASETNMACCAAKDAEGVQTAKADDACCAEEHKADDKAPVATAATAPLE